MVDVQGPTRGRGASRKGAPEVPQTMEGEATRWTGAGAGGRQGGRGHGTCGPGPVNGVVQVSPGNLPSGRPPVSSPVLGRPGRGPAKAGDWRLGEGSGRAGRRVRRGRCAQGSAPRGTAALQRRGSCGVARPVGCSATGDGRRWEVSSICLLVVPWSWDTGGVEETRFQ